MKIFSCTKHGGFTLIEVLVALVILAVGVLGVSSLQMHGLRNVKISGDLQEATRHVNELVELMRLNLDNLTDYNNLDSSVTSCVSPSSTQVALTDFCGVITRFKAAMPASNVTLAVSSCDSVNALCRVEADWRPRQVYGISAAPATVTYAVDARL